MRTALPLFFVFLWSSQTVYASSLFELYEQAITSDPRLDISQEEVQLGEARYDQAVAQLLPQISMRATLSENQREDLQTSLDDRYKGEKYSLVVQQKVFDLDKWHNRNRYENLSAESKVRLLEKEVQVTSDLTERYLNALEKQDALELIVAEKNATGKQLELLKSRYKRQLSILTDVLEVEARLDGILADEIAANAQVEIAYEALSELVGDSVKGPLLGFVDELDFAEDSRTLDDWTALALKNNLGLQALNYRLRASEAGLRQAKAIDYPTVDLTLNAQKSDIGFENTEAARTETYVAALNFTLPLYLGGSGTAKKAENRALLNIAQHEYEEMRRKILKDVRASYLNRKSSWARISAAKKAVKSAAKSYEAQEKGFTYGTVTVVDVLDALRENYRFRKDFRQAQYDFIVNWVQLLGVTGSLSAGDVEKINSWQKVSL